MSFDKPNTDYWNKKFAAYMHDPFDKVFDIKGHEERARVLLEKFGIDTPNDKFWRIADGIASGFERGQVPSYSEDKTKNGAVDFKVSPIITHPVSSKGNLTVKWEKEINTREIFEDLENYLRKIVGMKAGDGGYSDRFKGDESRFSKARFFYTHLVLRFKLSEENVSGLGALWHRLPADSRFPDHSIWQHNQLVSAIYSCMDLGEGDENKRKDNIGLSVFSITPVQPFISKARKLRDFWSGSVLLSYLAFEGIRWVMENLGPDHIVYPSLIDQPLVSEYLEREWEVKREFKPKLWRQHDKTIASFPNKFLFFIPFNKTEEIMDRIEHHIKSKWVEIANIVRDKIIKKVDEKITDEEKQNLKNMFKRQCDNYWDFQWACVRLVSNKDRETVSKLLAAANFENQFEVLDRFNEIIKDKQNYEKGGKGVLYSVSHSLVQSALAAEKTRKTIDRENEPGEKCLMCGEFEVLHPKQYGSRVSLGEYREGVRNFWDNIEELWKDSPDFKKNERLCSVCLVKRLLSQSLNKDHILYSVFKGYSSFPSTTMVALYDYFERKGITEESEKREIAQKLWEKDTDEHNSGGLNDVENREKYYAILLMDGDRMGDLINGKTIGATWESIMHPDIVGRLKSGSFDKKYSQPWKDIFKRYPKRLITPSIHAAISEALGDFAIYGVSNIVKKFDGRLIYAGGDDVCAVMPISTVLDAAREIAKCYKVSFRFLNDSNIKSGGEEISGDFLSESGKLSLGLGYGEKDNDLISISAGILICHHKENLSEMIKRAHRLLDEKAKEEGGRGACAIELRKRSGGSRFYINKWDNEKAWDSFKEIGQLIKENVDKVRVSTSMVYKLELFRDGINAILRNKSNNEKKRLNLIKFIAKQLERSQLANADNLESDDSIEERMAEKIVDICLVNGEFNTEALIIAAFMYGGN